MRGAQQTIQFHAQGGSVKANHWEKNTPYAQMLIDVIKLIMQGHTPKGFGFQDSKLHDFEFNKHLKMRVMGIWNGNEISIVKYQIHNIIAVDQDLSPEMFYKPNVRAIAITNTHLNANGFTTIYEVLSNEQ